MPEIGATLREARMRERIDVSEIEATTKIRAKYLRALENEEWDLLPGATFVKSFLRTYASALGLDAKALVEEYRLSYERPSEPPEPIVANPRRVRVPRGPRGPGGRGASRGYMALVGIVGILIVLLIVGLLSGGGGGSTSSTSARTNTSAKHRSGRAGATASGSGAARTGTSATATVSLSLQATGTVYVCLLGEGGRKLVAGQTLEAGTRTPTFHSRHFVLTLGNNAVTLLIDGTPRVVPASASAIGYSITKAGRTVLAPGHMPTCA